MSYDKEINKHGNILNSSKFKILKSFIAHGKTSTFKHSINVVKCGLGIIDKFNLKVNRDEFIKSALLHDLYFYDWHKTPKGKGLHGFTHAKDAAENGADAEISLRMGAGRGFVRGGRLSSPAPRNDAFKTI